MEQNSDFTRIREWASERGIYSNGDVKTQYIKLMEEAGELGQAILKDNEAEFKDAIGDMVVVLTNLAHLGNTTIEECITGAWNELKNRKGKMENGTFVKDNRTEEDKDGEWYMCIGLKEDKVHCWSSDYEIGKAYLKSNDYCGLEGCVYMHIAGIDSLSFCVDADQFDLMTSRYEQ